MYDVCGYVYFLTVIRFEIYIDIHIIIHSVSLYSLCLFILQPCINIGGYKSMGLSCFDLTFACLLISSFSPSY